jgi:hypothetical protein
MAKSFHKKADGSTVVRENGKISNNLPSGKTALPTAAPVIAHVPQTGTETSTSDIASIYTRFETLAKLHDGTPTVEELTAKIDEVEAKLEELRALPAVVDDAGKEVESIRVGDLAVDPFTYELDDLVTKTNAEYLLRLEKASFREARTDLLKAQDEANGLVVLEEFGDRKLGVAVDEGVYEPNSREWLLARTAGIGGSEKIGEINDLGQFIPFDESGRRRYLHKIFAKKTPAAVDAILTAEANADGRLGKPMLAAEIGNRLERTIQYEFAKAHPEYKHYEDKATRSAPGRSWHRFNVDGIVEDVNNGNLGVFEAKTSKSAETYEKARRGYMAQCLHNVAGAWDETGNGPKVTFAVLVADIEGEAEQRVIRMDFTEDQIRNYRAALDRAWLIHKPEYDSFAAESVWAR